MGIPSNTEASGKQVLLPTACGIRYDAETAVEIQPTKAWKSTNKLVGAAIILAALIGLTLIFHVPASSPLSLLNVGLQKPLSAPISREPKGVRISGNVHVPVTARPNKASRIGSYVGGFGDDLWSTDREGRSQKSTRKTPKESRQAESWDEDDYRSDDYMPKTSGDIFKTMGWTLAAILNIILCLPMWRVVRNFFTRRGHGPVPTKRQMPPPVAPSHQPSKGQEQLDHFRAYQAEQEDRMARLEKLLLAQSDQVAIVTKQLMEKAEKESASVEITIPVTKAKRVKPDAASVDLTASEVWESGEADDDQDVPPKSPTKKVDLTKEQLQTKKTYINTLSTQLQDQQQQTAHVAKSLMDEITSSQELAGDVTSTLKRNLEMQEEQSRAFKENLEQEIEAKFADRLARQQQQTNTLATGLEERLQQQEEEMANFKKQLHSESDADVESGGVIGVVLGAFQALAGKKTVTTDSLPKNMSVSDIQQKLHHLKDSLATLKADYTATKGQLPSHVQETLVDLESQVNVMIEADVEEAVKDRETLEYVLPAGSQDMEGVFSAQFVNVVKTQYDGPVADVNDKLPEEYDPNLIAAYWRARPRRLLLRTAEIVGKFGKWAATWGLDQLTGNGEKNEVRRARELTRIIGYLGPAFVKMGQAMSMRPDLMGQAYIDEFQRLQDSVPPFPDAIAQQIVKKSLPPGTNPASVFQGGLDAFVNPVAAASVGQVYKIKLVNGEEVAVKVQRPEILETVTLDLFVCRSMIQSLATATPLPGYLGESTAAWIGVIDDWAERFMEELHYNREAANQTRFGKNIQKSRILQNVIVVPKVHEVSSNQMLVTQWIEGTKLSSIDLTNAQGKKIIATLLNCYLSQLLETGFLHADPHLGNFLLQDDGKVVVLDYGLMSEISEDRRYGLLEFVVSLSCDDYETCLQCLIKLGFIPESINDDPEKLAIIYPVLADVMGTLGNGGGMAAFSPDKLVENFDDLVGEFPVMIPPYFGLILRTFSSLEGAGLSVDKGYCIVDECFPYMAQRLLTDDSPRMRKVLKTFIMGKGDRLQLDRLDSMIGGFKSFAGVMNEEKPENPESSQQEDEETESAVSLALRLPAALVAPPEVDPISKDTILVLLSPNGNYVQELALEELLTMFDASSRHVVFAVFSNVEQSAKNFMTNDSLWAHFGRAIPMSGILAEAVTTIAHDTAGLMNLTEEDKETVAVAQRIMQIVQPTGDLDMKQIQASLITARQWSPVMLDALPGIFHISKRAGEKILQRMQG